MEANPWDVRMILHCGLLSICSGVNAVAAERVTVFRHVNTNLVRSAGLQSASHSTDDVAALIFFGLKAGDVSNGFLAQVFVMCRSTFSVTSIFDKS
jgi:hypothetical protein